MKFKYGTVLTGGIATGKSTTAKIFKRYGVEIIDADEIGHQILDLYAEEVNELFEEELINKNIIDRGKLGKIIFSNEDERKKLNKFLHPKIKQEIILQSLSLENKEKIFLVDIPLFFETNNYSEFNKVIVVYSTPERQLKQLMERNGFSKEEALKRIASQLPIDEKKERASYIINNIKDIKYLEEECKRVFDEISKI